MPVAKIPPVFPPGSAERFMRFASRRSVVHSMKGMVACTQPLAAKCGVDILHLGGNAADAAVAVAAGLNVTEPCSTGIGGDMFCLFYSAATGRISALNGSGRSGAKYSLSRTLESLGVPSGAKAPDAIPMNSVHAVTVPGAAAGWCDTVERFGSGRLGMAQILAPAIELAEKGFPVSEIAARSWQDSEAAIRAASPNFAEILKPDPSAPDRVRAPRAGEVIRLPSLGRTLRTLAAEGKRGFYTGRIAQELERVCGDLGGLLQASDLRDHMDRFGGSQAVAPVALRGFLGRVDVWEHPPNGQGIVALMALGLLEEFGGGESLRGWGPADHNSAAYLHAVIEALRIAFADAVWFVADPDMQRVPTEGLLDRRYLRERSALFNPDRASKSLDYGDPLFAGPSPAQARSDTVYFCCADKEGNAISFINSNFGGFGTCIIPRGCGFTLQNRGAGFSLDGAHPNAIAPCKRPYHTIIPALVTNHVAPAGSGTETGSLHSVFGVMGGFMQPQGHVQVLLGQLVGGLSPQQALDAPRVCIGSGMARPREDCGAAAEDRAVYVEEGMLEETMRGLRERGHDVRVVTGAARAMFGRGQVIRQWFDPVDGARIWSAGSDMRGDGAAYPA